MYKQLEAHLALLKKEGIITVWSDHDISAGTEWKRELDTRLNKAQIILLLISADFLASEYLYSTEVERAMEMHEAGTARVIPIILRHTLWETAPFGKLQALPKKGKSVEPVTGSYWQNTDEAFLNVAKGIRKVIKELTGAQTQAIPGQPIRAHFQPIIPIGFPQARTLIGRDTELTKLMEYLLAGEASNICALHGMGGVGKTSLAAEAAVLLSRDRKAFPGGVAWISCEGFVGSEGLNSIWGQIISAIRLEQLKRLETEEKRTFLVSELTRFPRLLLVLDNIEPQLDVEALLNTLDIPDHTVLLLTSRQTLAPEKLTVLQLRPLADNDAVFLFTQRIKQVDANRSLQDETKEISAIITALGGLPLAIELVAAYAGIQCLPLSQILLELEQDKVEATSLNFDSRKALLSRFHRSWIALSPQEQRLFASLSLFKGITFLRTGALALAKIAKEENSIELARMYFGDIARYAQQDLLKLVAYALVEPLPNQQLRLHPLLGEYASLRFNELPPVVCENMKTAFTVFWSAHTPASYEGLSALEAYRFWQTAGEVREKRKLLELQAGFSQEITRLGLPQVGRADAYDSFQIALYVAKHGEPNLGRHIIEKSLAESTQEDTRAECHLRLAEIDNNEKNHDNAIKHYREAQILYKGILYSNEQRLKISKNSLKNAKAKQGKRGIEIEIGIIEENISTIHIKLREIQANIQKIPLVEPQNKTRGFIH
ncbi:MAG TPA: NB-ARC domain-containing protein, partial [Ktedonobacteraceae bacterium]|nr:NB-ARC domain-containing protein [Ktedonobacteraceae bacterium]